MHQPNYKSPISASAEVGLRVCVDTWGREWGAALLPAPDNLMELARELVPERLHHISTKAPLSEGDGLLDQLGVDYLLSVEGQVYAIDVTTGSSSVIKNKRKKMENLSPLLLAMGAEPVVLCWRNPVSSEDWFVEFLSRIMAGDRDIRFI